MLKRKAADAIKNWVNSKEKKCLVVQGARQTGKTYIIERFAEENYEEFVEINFKQMLSAMDIFSGDLTVDNSGENDDFSGRNSRVPGSNHFAQILGLR